MTFRTQYNGQSVVFTGTKAQISAQCLAAGMPDPFASRQAVMPPIQACANLIAAMPDAMLAQFAQPVAQVKALLDLDKPAAARAVIVALGTQADPSAEAMRQRFLAAIPE